MSNISRLKQALAQATRANSLGGADILQHLAALSHACIKDGSSDQKAIAYALASFLDANARDRQGRAVSAAENAALSPETLARAVALLESPGDPKAVVDIIAAIADMDSALGS